MRRLVTPFLVAGLAAAVGACTDSKRAARDATWGDKPADITCWTYGTQTYAGRSTGKVEYDEGGRISFVDAANGRYTTIEGDCRVVYAGEDDDAPAPATPGAAGGPVAPPPAVPEA